MKNSLKMKDVKKFKKDQPILRMRADVILWRWPHECTQAYLDLTIPTYFQVKRQYGIKMANSYK